MDLADRYNAVLERVDIACREAGRRRDSVSLIAVSKTHPPQRIRDVMARGQLHFGESYAQELRDKGAQIEGLHWHFIGRVQTNKAKYIAPVAYRVHALESIRQAEALTSRAPGTLHALMSVNVGREDSKGGVLPEDVLTRAKALSRVEGLKLCGLMTLPPAAEDPEDTAPYFAELAHLATEARREGMDLTELSMGMSHDFHVAIRHGATWVRVGTALFGPRVARR